ncbi:hypothetical protein Vadar_034026 [Vaccinium darrowii]|uniref:Uncharacterized protein n=1 Tax=Vaccinium darrowii TaxID=229202 RepID=A0ACB7XLR4_9ERIC|nr:hypothetical protein Vadar_034026 [Vaccinium darrowii]
MSMGFSSILSGSVHGSQHFAMKLEKEGQVFGGWPFPSAIGRRSRENHDTIDFLLFTSQATSTEIEYSIAIYQCFPSKLGRTGERLIVLCTKDNEGNHVLGLKFKTFPGISILMSLPQDIGLTLPNLQWMVFAVNQFWGPFPVSISNASRMEVIDISKNNLSGLVPIDLGRKMKDLWKLNLGENNLGSGDASDLMFIDSLTNCSKLRRLAFPGNGLGGVLPTSIANLSSNLILLAAGGNQLVGSIPVGISNFINLTILGLEENTFSGVIPFEIGKLRNLQFLVFLENELCGPIPASIGNLTRIFFLSLGDNNLNGTIPSKYGVGGKISEKGDVYSYGILLLEMLTGRRPTNEMFTGRQSLHEFCRSALPERVMGIIDSRMLFEEPQNEKIGQAKVRECLISLMRIGVACSAESPSERMNVRDALAALTKTKEVFLGVGIHGKR